MKARYDWLKSLFTDARLTTRFAVYSFLCIGLMTVVLWLIVSNYLVKQILKHEWETTAQMVRADVRKFLEDYDFKAQDRKSVGHKFAALLDHMRLSPAIVRFKVFNNRAVVIWSDDKQLVGKSFSDDPELAKALEGDVIANLSSLVKGAATYGTKPAVKTVEVYVPIYSENERQLLGVFETYREADSILQEIREARVVVLLAALGGGLLVYISLFAIVRQAARKIDEQQRNLLQMQSELIATQRMAAIGEIAGAVAHGIGNPLSSIRAAAKVALLENAEGDGCEANQKTTENLHNIVREVDRVQRRMQGLLNFAKPLEPHPMDVEINALVSDAVETLRNRFNEAKVSLRLDLAADLPSITSDPSHLEQALMGLLTNALEATPQGGVVTIRTGTSVSAEAEKTVYISIEDDGEGIPTENRERVFEPFFTTKSHGTGIGLPLAKKFVEINHGKVTIASGSRVGTRVEMTLPLTATDSATSVALRAGRDDPNTGSAGRTSTPTNSAGS
jgi:two-component system, NtrC family, sensor histidine kinase HydH